MKKFLAIALALTLVLGCLAGCQTQKSKPEPKTAEELVKLVGEAMKDTDNFRADMEMAADIQIKAQTKVEGVDLQMEIAMPIELSMKLASAGNYQNGDMDLSMNISVKASANGQSQTQEQKFSAASKMYMVQDGKTNTTYSKSWDQDGSEADAKWVKSESEGDDLSQVSEIFTEEDLWSLATMEKVDGGYTLSIKLADLLKDEDIRKKLGESDTLDLGELDLDQVIEILGDAVLIATVDGESFQLKSAALTNFTVGKALEDMVDELCSSMMGVDFDDLDITFDLDCTFQFSDYGKVPDQEVRVPDDVAAQAVEEVPDDEPPFPSVTEPEPSSPIGSEPPLDDPVVITDPIDPGVSAGSLTGDKLLDIQMDGTALPFPMDMEVLKTLGWTVGPEEYNTFYVMTNSKYTETGCLVSLKDLHNFNGFQVSAAPDAVHPDVSIAGIKLGHTYKDVYANTGKPDGTYASEEYFSINYKVQINGMEYGLDITMEASETANGYDYANAVVTNMNLACYG